MKLNSSIFGAGMEPSNRTGEDFTGRVYGILREPLRARGIRTLQVNLGYQCNMTCRHCHLSAGPKRTEAMHRENADAVLGVLREHPLDTLDLTGGSPEVNPHFRYLVTEARRAGKRVIVRTNLTIFFEEGMQDLPEFYREQGVDVIASLPCYLEDNVDALRGNGAFHKSIDALRKLNRLGIGRDSDAPSLSLVYNPGGPFLPPPQPSLEADYRKELKRRYGICFTRLYTFTNMPIGRFRESLVSRGESERYVSMLASAFNPATLDSIMCRSILSVAWNGTLYDCDFNQILGIAVTPESTRTIRDFDYETLSRRIIAVNDHCYGCTAGQGST